MEGGGRVGGLSGSLLLPNIHLSQDRLRLTRLGLDDLERVAVGEHLKLRSEATLASPQPVKTGLLWSAGQLVSWSAGLTFMQLNCFSALVDLL